MDNRILGRTVKALEKIANALVLQALLRLEHLDPDLSDSVDKGVVRVTKTLLKTLKDEQ